MSNSIKRLFPFYNADAAEYILPPATRSAEVKWSYNTNYAEILGINEAEVFPVLRCMVCHFLYAQLLPSPDFQNFIYEHVIHHLKAHAASLDASGVATRMKYISTLARLVDVAATTKPPTALDFGCGFGVNARLLKELGYHVVAFDPSLERRRVVRSDNSEIEVVDNPAALHALGPFDVFVLDNVLEHVPDPMATLRDFAAICTRSAVGYVSVPSYEPRRVKALVRAHKRGKPVDMTLNPWEHLNYFRAPRRMALSR
jgi:SAM-dependent methyltransferase